MEQSLATSWKRNQFGITRSARIQIHFFRAPKPKPGDWLKELRRHRHVPLPQALTTMLGPMFGRGCGHGDLRGLRSATVHELLHVTILQDPWSKPWSSTATSRIVPRTTHRMDPQNAALTVCAHKENAEKTIPKHTLHACHRSEKGHCGTLKDPSCSIL